MLFHGGTRTPAPDNADADTVVDYTGRRTRYLTDGVDLYRFVGTVAGRLGQMIGLENCRSLELMLLPVDELRQRKLRAVTPALHSFPHPVQGSR